MKKIILVMYLICVSNLGAINNYAELVGAITSLSNNFDSKFYDIQDYVQAHAASWSFETQYYVKHALEKQAIILEKKQQFYAGVAALAKNAFVASAPLALMSQVVGRLYGHRHRCKFEDLSTFPSPFVVGIPLRDYEKLRDSLIGQTKWLAVSGYSAILSFVSGGVWCCSNIYSQFLYQNKINKINDLVATNFA